MLNIVKKIYVLLDFFLLFALTTCLVSSMNQEYWVKQLSTHEKDIFEAINGERVSNNLTPLRLNEQLSKAISQELTDFAASDWDSMSFDERINQISSLFEKEVYVFTDTQTEKIIERLGRKKSMRDQLLSEESISVIISPQVIHDKPTNTWIYFSRYFAEYLIVVEMAIPDGDKMGRVVSETIEGETNAKYMKMLCYQDRKLPLLERDDEIYEKELEVDQDSSFVFSLPINRFRKQPWSIALFARTDPSIPYELVGFITQGE